MQLLPLVTFRSGVQPRMAGKETVNGDQLLLDRFSLKAVRHARWMRASRSGAVFRTKQAVSGVVDAAT
jgi:hypothetical protein